MDGKSITWTKSRCTLGQQLGSIGDNIEYFKKIYTNLEVKYPNNVWVNNIKESVLSLEKTWTFNKYRVQNQKIES